MKKILLFFAMLVTVTAGYAQDDKQCCKAKDGKECKEGKDCSDSKDKAPSVEQITMDMVSQLQLDEKQAAQLKALNEEYAEVLRAPGRHHGPGHHRRGPRGPRQDMMAQAQDGAQQEELQQAPQMSRREGRPRLESRDDSKRGEMHAKRAEYEQKLNEILTPEQQEKLRSMRPEPRGQRRQ